MHIFLLDSMANSKSKALKTAVKALGLISILIMVKGSIVMSYSCDLFSKSLLEFWNSIGRFSSSTLHILIIVNLMVLLIAISSSFHPNPENENLDDHDISSNTIHDDLDVQSIKSRPAPPPPAAPPPPIPPFHRNHDVQSKKWQPPPPSVVPPPSVTPLPRNMTEVVAAATTTTKTYFRTTSAKDLLGNKPRPPPQAAFTPPPSPVARDIFEAVTTSSTTSVRAIKNLSQPKKTDQDKVRNLFTENPSFSSSIKNKEPHEIKKTSHPQTTFADPLKERMLKPSIHSFPNKEKEIHLEKEEEMILNPSNDSENEDEDGDTLEATWKAISGSTMKNKELKKSQTLRNICVQVQRLDSEEVIPSTPKWKEMRKSETFNDAVSRTRRGGLRRDPSTSLEEFNKRVEAAIKKFNDDLRLQRQESDQRLLDMINRGL